MIGFVVFVTALCAVLVSLVVLFDTAKSGMLRYRQLSALRHRSGDAITPPIASLPKVGTHSRNASGWYRTGTAKASVAASAARLSNAA